MKTIRHSSPLLFGAAIFWLSIGAVSCVSMDDGATLPDAASRQQINFDVLVTRDGKVVTKAGQGVTKAGGGDAYS